MDFQRAAVMGLSLVGCLAVGLGVSQDVAQSTVTVAEHEELGRHLADGEGRSLYLYANDEAGDSTCADDCAEAWPPFTVEDGPVAGEGVASSLLGTMQREDGSRQVTYNGWPLYSFADDSPEASGAGHGVAGAWFLVSPYGEALPVPEDEGDEQSGEEADGASEPVPEAALAGGREVYAQHCAACHGMDGGGGAGPALDEARAVRDEARVVDQILWGGNRMPSFGSRLSDGEVAAVATYVRNSFGHEFGLTVEEVVAEER